MAPPAGTLRVGRYFLALLVLFAILYTIVFFGSRQTPKLGIDLVGGTQVVFTAKTDNGTPPTTDSMNQARNILADRVNGTGVTQATVNIQGTDQLVVAIPGQDATDIQKLGAAAQLNFRGVVVPPVAIACTTKPAATSSTSPSATTSGSGSATTSPTASTSTSPSPSTSASASESGAAAAVRPLAKATPTGSTKSASTSKTASTTKSASTSTSPSASTTKASGTTSASTTPTPTASASQAPAKCSPTSVKQVAAAGKFTVPLTDTAAAKLSATNTQLLAAGLANFDCSSAQGERDEAKNFYVACGDASGTGQPYAYLLGPVVVAGKQVDTASAVAPNGTQSFDWTVQLTLKDSGQSAWANYTKAHNVSGDENTAGVTSCSASATPCADYVGFTLDGSVISSPVNLNAINGQDTQITGSFTANSAKDLANKLKFGALPLSFQADTAQTVSATLGTSQLEAGLLAGGIGLILVVIYSLMYYRALGLVTIASLLVSGGLTYGALVMLGTQIGFTLSLAGIAGFIVAVGITADSFVVFFERLKDEVHEGRSVRVAVPRAWVRARRTILSADTVSFLAAAVLYYFTTDEVRGFAFTLGLSTILDLAVVFLFTHPLVSLLSRSAAFGSARFTGLDSLRGTPLPDEPAERRATPTKKAPAKRAGAQTADAGDDELPDYSGVTVIDKKPAVALDKQPDASSSTDDVETDVDTDTGSVDSTDAPVEADDEPRRRTAPEPGSAAERAAARRARLRDEKGRD